MTISWLSIEHDPELTIELIRAALEASGDNVTEAALRSMAVLR
jgi:hypothetical protein